MEEKELIKLAIDGDAAAFEQLVENYRGIVFSVLAKLVSPNDVPDVANETFIHFFRSLESYRGQGSLSGWLSTIATRRACDHWRIVWRHREKTVSSLSYESVRHMDNAAAGAALERFRGEEDRQTARSLVGNVLDHLTPDDRMAITLVHLQDLSIEEAAERLGWSKAKVKVRVHRARQRMKELLEEMES